MSYSHFRVSLLICFILCCSSLVAFAQPGPALMNPTGPYSVGVTQFDWVDLSRPEPATADPNDHRQLPVQIWYPAQPNAGLPTAAYRPRVEALRKDWGDESVDFYRSVTTTWTQDAPIHRDSPFPVLIFSHGWSARSSSHGSFVQNLASQGYIVVGMNHPFMGKVVFADGTVTEPDDNHFDGQRSADAFYGEDIKFVLSQIELLNNSAPDQPFSNTIDMSRVAAGGHSSGFPAAVAAAVHNDDIRALISFDSGASVLSHETGALKQPILLFRAETDSYTDLYTRGDKVHPNGTIYGIDFFRYYEGELRDLVIENTIHSSIYDLYLFGEDPKEQKLARRNHEIIQLYAVAFLDLVLSGKESELLGGNSPEAPHVELRLIEAKPLEERATSDADFRFQELSDQCSAVITDGPTGNAAIFRGGTATLVVDSHVVPTLAETVIDYVDSSQAAPIQYLVNTHRHIDHVHGNSAYAAHSSEITVIAHPLTADDLKEKATKQLSFWPDYFGSQIAEHRTALESGEEMSESEANWRRKKLWRGEELLLQMHRARIEVPTLLVEEGLELDLGGMQLEILHAPGHTDGDLVVWDPSSRVLVAGDLVIETVFMGIDSPATYFKSLKMLRDLNPRWIIPGHGEVMEGVTSLDELIVALSELIGATQQAFSDGLKLEATQLKLEQIGFSPRLAGAPAMITAAYQEIAGVTRGNSGAEPIAPSTN
jgi:glyoxylase-like metal-dependent hydrolase (beta-lactamase superfamily II)/dienelactone hydrolase